MKTFELTDKRRPAPAELLLMRHGPKARQGTIGKQVILGSRKGIVVIVVSINFRFGLFENRTF